MKPIGGLITAITITLVSLIGSFYLNNKQNIESKNNLYTELLSTREQAESALRKDMFNSILGTILKNSGTLDENILKLELLAYNFHESLNLMPLFDYLNRKISLEKNPVHKEEYRKRLYRVARNVSFKEISSLEGVVLKKDFHYYFTSDSVKYRQALSPELPIDTTFSTVFNDTVKSGNTREIYKRTVFLKVTGCNVDEKTVNMRLDIETSLNGNTYPMVTQQFSIDYFQFPMIDNTRLSNDMRCAVVMTNFAFPKVIDLTILYFPGSHSSLKDKPYYDDVIKNILTK
ncbi:MAG: hypothetical protein WCI54_00895 [Bacteroidia bacterium]